MPLDTLRETRRRWNCFSKVDQLGAFDFYTYTVSLDAIQPAALSIAQQFLTSLAHNPRWLTLDEFRSIDTPISLAIHEYTHFTDASSTLWGLRHLNLLEAANRARGNTLGEEVFPPAKQFFDHVRSIRWPEYYTERYVRGDQTKRPWSAEVTGGRVFDGSGKISRRPIVFVRFDDSTGSPIVRSPLSAVSVLEASAFGQELMYRMHLVSALEKDVRLVETREMTRQVMDYIYQEDLTEYSVCAHLFANQQRCPDAATVYACVALLARRTLNFPVAALSILSERIGTVLQEVLQWDPASKETALIRDGIDAHDLGAIFYVLVRSLPANSHTSHDGLLTGLQRAVGRFGLDEKTIREWADAEARQAAEELLQSPLYPIRTLAAAGLSNYRAISWQHRELLMTDLHLPSVVLGDLSPAQPFANPDNALSSYDVERAYDDLVKGQIWIEKFADACF